MRVPVFEEGVSQVQIRFLALLDLSATDGVIDIDPGETLVDISWDQGTSLEGEDWTSAWITFNRPFSERPVEVTVKAGLRARSGAMLKKDVSFRLEFLKATRAEIAVEGMGYLNGGAEGSGRLEISSAAPPPVPPLFKPGSARLRISFTRPVDTDEVWEVVRSQLVRSQLSQVAVGDPEWNEAGTELSVPLTQTGARHVRLGFGGYLGAGGEVHDELGMVLEQRGSRLEWIVAEPLAVHSAKGFPEEMDAVGVMAVLPHLGPVGSRALHENRLLTWHEVGDDGDCYTHALTLWDIGSGTAVPLGEPFSACMAWAGWQGGGEGILAGTHKVVARYRLGAADPWPEPDAPTLAAETFYVARGEDRIIVGMVPAPDGKVAVFEASLPRGDGRVGRIDLVVLGKEGAAVRRLEGVSDLVSTEGFWRTIQADWSDDGTVLVFNSYRAGSKGSSSGVPLQVSTQLSLWREGSGDVDVFDLPAETVSWRRGTSEVAVLSDTWVGFDAVSGEVSGELGIPQVWKLLWSPDGRYVAWYGDYRGSGILDLQTGRRRAGEHFHPLGWSLPAGPFYWAE